MSWFGFVALPDPDLRPEILYNDIGRAYYAKAMRTYGPYTPEEQNLARQSSSLFLQMTTKARIRDYEAAEDWFDKSHSQNPSFFSPCVNSIYTKFGLYADTGTLSEQMGNLESEVQMLLSQPELDDLDRNKLEQELAFLRKVRSSALE
jgi:hypothetical protein